MFQQPIKDVLHDAGVRPTEQRLAISRVLFSQGARHLTAEQLNEELAADGQKVALATVYNTLHQLTEAGLVRQIFIDKQRTYFDTNVHHHHHFFDERDGSLIDIASDRIDVKLDAADPLLALTPSDMSVASVDVVIRLKAKS